MGIVGHTVSGKRLGPDDSFWLAAASLPMGHSWSLYFCQRSIGLRAASVPELAGCTLMCDRGPSVLLRPTASGDTTEPEPTESAVPPRRVLRIYDPAMGPTITSTLITLES
jgi:hypothetical protein